MNYKVILKDLKTLLDTNVSLILTSRVDCIYQYNQILSGFKYKSTISSCSVSSGSIKVKLNNDILKFNFEILNNQYSLTFDHTSILTDSEIIEYLEKIDNNKLESLLNPSYSFGSDTIKLPLTEDTYNTLSISHKNDIKDLIRNLDCYNQSTKRDSGLDDLFD